MTDNQSLAWMAEHTPGPLRANLDRAIRQLFADGHLSAIRAAFAARLAAPPGDGAGTVSAYLQGKYDIKTAAVTLPQLQRAMVEMVLKASGGLDEAASKFQGLHTAQGATWEEAVQHARGRIEPPFIWIASTAMEKPLQPMRRRNVVDLPGRGLQPDARMLDADIYFRPERLPPDKLYVFRCGGGLIWFPKPLQVLVTVEPDNIHIEFDREAILELHSQRGGAEVSLVAP